MWIAIYRKIKNRLLSLYEGKIKERGREGLDNIKIKGRSVMYKKDIDRQTVGSLQIPPAHSGYNNVFPF